MMKVSSKKVELIKEAKEIGFTLTEIKNLLNSWYSKRLGTEKKVEILQNKITEIDEKIRQLKQVKKYLMEGIRDVRAGNC